ncbi:hypothetical protein DEU38_13452 [Rhodococcus sp. AG1013]|nr:hypothetical protein DEU38_13452 [Rhodococcus sp. AG1013]
MSLGEDQFGTTEPNEWMRERYGFLFPERVPSVEQPRADCAFAHLHLIQQELCEGCGWDGRVAEGGDRRG